MVRNVIFLRRDTEPPAAGQRVSLIHSLGVVYCEGAELLRRILVVYQPPWEAYACLLHTVVSPPLQWIRSRGAVSGYAIACKFMHAKRSFYPIHLDDTKKQDVTPARWAVGHAVVAE
eukprot:4389230-Prymnesium_polylepis.1